MDMNITQLQYESNTWKRLIEFIKLENAHCKNRMSEVIKNKVEDDSIFLETAEYYQDYYIKQDTLVEMLRSDVYVFDKLLEKELYLDGALATEIFNHRKRLRIEMEKLSVEYNKGCKQFNNFLDANSQS